MQPPRGARRRAAIPEFGGQPRKFAPRTIWRVAPIMRAMRSPDRLTRGGSSCASPEYSYFSRGSPQKRSFATNRPFCLGRKCDRMRRRGSGFSDRSGSGEITRERDWNFRKFSMPEEIVFSNCVLLENPLEQCLYAMLAGYFSDMLGKLYAGV